MNKSEQQAKEKLDELIARARVHFYKPIQIAEILFRHRVHSLDLSTESNYINPSKHWRDGISHAIVGKTSSSSDGYQKALFSKQLPRKELLTLAEVNFSNGGLVEAYIYKSFENKVGDVSAIHKYLDQATSSDFRLEKLETLFSSNPGLRRSMDKLFEILAYSILSAIIEALEVEVSIEIRTTDQELLRTYEDFCTKVLGITVGTSKKDRAKVFRVGTTNAADGGLDLWASYGPAIQVKNISLNSSQVEKITDGVRADRFILVCKEAEKPIIQSVLEQAGAFSKVQSVVTAEDMHGWYKLAFSESFRHAVGEVALEKIREEFDYEFPYSSSDDGATPLSKLLGSRGYSEMQMFGEWGLE